MTYRYEDLGDDDFQLLVQTLLTGPGETDLRAMPLGQADGGRDATSNDTVFQVKFSIQGPRLANSDKWLLRALDAEQASIRSLVARGYRNYVLATNVGGTGVLDRGTIDKVDAEVKKRSASWGIGITIWWRNDIDARFRASNVSIKIAFQRALLPDELMAITRLRSSNRAGRVDKALNAYVADQYEYDNRVRFEQADLNGPTVDQLFVDVLVTAGSPMTQPAKLLSQIGSPSTPRNERDPSSGDVTGWSAGAGRLLLHPDWSGSAAIIGGPGRGKTTLLQYVCQYHRARHLGITAYEELHRATGPTSSAIRLPIRIDLKRYAEWPGRQTNLRVKRDKKAQRSGVAQPEIVQNNALELYLVEHIGAHSGGLSFSIGDLVQVFTDRPVLLALDGLDEVADLADRSRVASEVGSAAARLQTNSVDLVILLTTRPGATGFPEELRSRFPILQMQPLSDALRLQYLYRWAMTAGLDPDRTQQLRDTFIRRSVLPHVSELSSNPMQLAILLHLLQRRGILPEQRTRLYTDYVQVFLDREAPKDPVVREHRNLIEDVHAYLGWHIQSTAELGKSSGAVSIQELRSLLANYLRGRGVAPEIMENLFSAVTGRVICLVQREIGYFEFEVQPLREYFAARHLFDNAPNTGKRNSKDDCFDALLPRPYWSNVMRFFAGNLTKGEVRAIPSHLRSLTKAREFDLLPVGRAVAIQLLEDQVFLNQTSGPLEEVVEHAFGGRGASLAVRGLVSESGAEVVLGRGSGRSHLIAHCAERLGSESDSLVARDVSSLLLANADQSFIDEWWTANRDVLAMDESWLEIASGLDKLSDFGGRGLPEMTAAAHKRVQSFPAMLARAGSMADDDQIIRQGLDDIGDGWTLLQHGSSTRNFNRQSPLLTLWNKSRSVAILRFANGGPLESDVLEWDDPRWRRVMDQALPLSQIAVRVLSFIENKSWRSRLGGLFQVFGDSWLLREAALSIPREQLVITSIALGLDDIREPDSLVRWIYSMHENKDDSAWWHDQLANARGVLSIRTWLFSILGYGSSGVVADSIDQIAVTIDGLETWHSAAALTALEELAGTGSLRRVELRDLLRVGRIKPSGLAALLLMPVSWDLTRTELVKIVVDNLESIVNVAEPLAVSALGVLADAGATASIESLSGLRRWPSVYGALEPVTIARPTVNQARKILSAPQMWPARVVAAAVDRLGDVFTQLPPLASVAVQDEWCIVP